ncbi:sugar ABC transporter ATP-binding protein [Labrys miyagiensis]|uniref:Sugar ABC transporter ATP-binding protein n=1 Tax=Labrys miyagiensis TaxID=346912 RepID=A0ABQ6CUL6_9HYPH|nr:sn-glycerol-3-phosphate ABC transporter ATP-binding protein UgpC [Labrys miyagiensis]GLS23374.1 sugar ABC transporter ATP-binding protein [Labrys miyagiensis]
MANVSLSNIRKRYGNVETIHGVSLEIDHGEFCVFVGPSGCGKSTLLRMIAGLEDISDGELGIDEEIVNDVDPSERGVAMVFQNYALYPHMSVRDNMSFGLRISGRPKAEVIERVNAAGRILQLDAMMDRKPSQLSGGQRQRVAIGRAIVRNPKVFLFDEPLSNLDAELRVAMRVEIAKLHQELGNTMIYVTHDQTEAMTLADKIVVLKGGNIEQVGSPIELYERPVNIFVAGFIGSPKMNFLNAIRSDGSPSALGLAGKTIDAPALAASGQRLKLGIRPEHFDRGDAPDVSLSMHVDVVENLGGSSFIYGRTPTDENLVIERRDGRPLRSGELIEVGFNLRDVHFFDENGLRVG